jgi:hypothetical protein
MDAAGPRFEEDVAAEAPGCRPVVLEVGESASFPAGPTGEG